MSQALVSAVVSGRIERLKGAPGGFARNVSVASRLALVVVLVALVSVVVTAYVGLGQGDSLAEDEIEDQLSAVGAARADQVERYINGLERAIVSQALTPRPALAIEEFTRVYRDLNAERASARDSVAVEDYYREVVAPELSDARDRPVNAASLLPVSDAAITLQAQFVVPDPDTGEPPARLPEWTELDDPLDAALSEFALRSGFDDVYLIDPEAKVVVYSTAKSIDFATSLRSGPQSGTQLAALIDGLSVDPMPGDVAIRDFAPYPPAGDRASAFVGSPVFLDGELAGYVAGRFDPSEITDIMTNNQNWGSLGETGETYVVGADTRMRSDSRLFLEDRPAYFEQVEAAGTATDEELRSMRVFGTTVLFQSIDFRVVEAAMDEPSDVDVVTNYLGDEVMSGSRVVALEGLDWLVFAQAELAAIRSPIDDFVRNLLVAIAVFIVVVTFVAVRWADRLLEPLRVVSTRLRAIRDRDEAGDRPELPKGSADEFVELADDIDTMLVTLHERTARARQSADERRLLLRRLLPAPIAERAEAGDRDVVEQVATATVAVLVIGGLGTLVTAGTPERARELLDRFVDEADELAAERGLDRIQLSGDSYVAACGVSRPYLDHAARAADFVLDVCEMLGDLDPDGGLYVRAGLDVGPITVGLTGGARLIHDTWGSTVQVAVDLARSARRGQILVSEACRTHLPAKYVLEPTDRGGVSVLDGVAVDSETSS
jgi:class 3 adenylate cyclase